MLTGKAGLKDTLFSDDLSIDGSRLDCCRSFDCCSDALGHASPNHGWHLTHCVLGHRRTTLCA